MVSYLLALTLLVIPLLISGLRTERRGIITGLFISLFFWSRFHPLLVFVPLSCALCIFFSTKPYSYHRTSTLWVKKPSFPMFVVFLMTMCIFCAFGEALSHYGRFLELPAKILASGESVANFAYLMGPIVLGAWCDRKGPYFAAVLLTLISEVSVLLAANSQMATTFFIISTLSIHFCISGFFVLMPVISSTFFGEREFFRTYPAVALLASLIWFSFRHLITQRWSDFFGSGDFLISLLILSIMSAFFLYISWKRRFSLVLKKDQRAS